MKPLVCIFDLELCGPKTYSFHYLIHGNACNTLGHTPYRVEAVKFIMSIS